MPQLVILRGNSGSGKSTAAKCLQEKLGRGTLLVSRDMVRIQMLHVYGGQDALSVDLIGQLLRFGSQNCAVTILEGILRADAYGALFRQLPEWFPDQIYSYYFDIPFAETLRRHAQKPNSHEFGETQMRGWFRSYEDDRIDGLPETIIHQTQSTEEIAARIAADLAENGECT